MCLLRAFQASCWRSNTSFVLVGVVAQYPPGEAIPRSMVATCWRFSPWCLQHRHTGPRFFSPQLPLSPAHRAALYFWMQNLTDHIELQSILLLLWRSKRALFMCISFLQLRSLSVITVHAESTSAHLSVWVSALFVTKASCSWSALCVSTKKKDY